MEPKFKRNKVNAASSVVAPFSTWSLVTAHVNPLAGSLVHVRDVINTFLDNYRKWTLENAADQGKLSVLDRLLSIEWFGVSKQFRQTRFL